MSRLALVCAVCLALPGCDQQQKASRYDREKQKLDIMIGQHVGDETANGRAEIEKQQRIVADAWKAEQPSLLGKIAGYAIPVLCVAFLIATPFVFFFAQPREARYGKSTALPAVGRGVLIVLAIIAVGALLAIGAKLVL